MVFSSTQTIPGISHSTPAFSRSGGHLHWQRHLNGQPKHNSSSHGFWLVMSSLVWDQGLQSCVYLNVAIYVFICYCIYVIIITTYIRTCRHTIWRSCLEKNAWLEPNNGQWNRFFQSLLICSSISREDGDLLLICSSLRTAQKRNSEQKN